METIFTYAPLIAALNMAYLAATVSAVGWWNVVLGKVLPAILAVILVAPYVPLK